MLLSMGSILDHKTKKSCRKRKVDIALISEMDDFRTKSKRFLRDARIFCNTPRRALNYACS